MPVTDVGKLIAGRYRLVDRIAVGGMGVVWEGADKLLGRRVAVKQVLIQPGLSEAEALLARQRVIREARITARLHHPHAVTIYDVVDDDDYPCLIMQFVPVQQPDRAAARARDDSARAGEPDRRRPRGRAARRPRGRHRAPRRQARQRADHR